MSQINVNSIKSSDGATDLLTLSNGSLTGAIATGGRRNLIINGAMQVAQRGTSVTNTAGGFKYNTVDRFLNGSSGTGARYTISQVSDAPDGFANSLKYDCTTADTSVSANDYVRLGTRLEGQDLQGLAFGTSSAKSITVSFWVKSSVTGQYSLTINTEDGTDTRQRVEQYTINSANTWEQKVITLEGDTDSGGTIRNTNERGIMIFWSLLAGSTTTATDDGGVWHDAGTAKRHYGQTAVVGANVGETWQITGVQLEVGDTATPFEHRSYGEELALCQRYFWRKAYNGAGTTMIGAGMAYSTTDIRCCLINPVPMRGVPTITYGGSTFKYERPAAGLGALGSLTSANRTAEASLLYSGSGTDTGTQGAGAFWYLTSSSDYIDVSAEL